MLDSQLYANMATPSKTDTQDNMSEDKSPENENEVFTSISMSEAPFNSHPEKRGRGRPKKNSTGLNTSARRSLSVDNRSKRTRPPSSSCISCMKDLEEGKTIQCQMCDGHSCYMCSKIPTEMITFMTSGTCPWICRHCNRAGLPTLKNINDNVTKQSKQIKDLRDTTDRQYTNLEKKMVDLEKSIDSKINKKFESNKEEMKKEIEEKITTELTKQIDEEMERIRGEQIVPDMEKIEKNITDKISKKIDEIVEEKMKNTEWPGHTDLEEKIERLIQEKIKTNIDTVDENLVKKIDSMIEDKIKENPIQNSTRNAQMVSPGTYMKTTVKNVANELKEKEKRMHNIIIFGLQVPVTDNETSRNEADKSNFVEFITKNLEIVLGKEDIKENFRLGRYDSKDNNSKTLPLMIVLKSLEMKEKIFKNLYKLRGQRDVTFNHDYTRLEREENKKLQEEAKVLTKNDPGSMYRVRGPPWDRKIVKLTTKEEVITALPIQLLTTEDQEK